ncbi:glucose-1-phosphate thymidylyltransferase [Schnuerera sp. xch1]|uniref:glucose-1-phosphate thymidylyltransferase n=1 Tax=Schnuerera sp. xch1 TaxID=2874283 RepID=UPI001CBB8CC5|nr:glucose-1-phosphate thymidylyltransferase [Schnuerera sp. xch1]MBZ2173700.1 glucose-1-phosphate thymidylyltransferase [Schnuerera sp. xch1]
MKSIILCGGKGTRLQPITYTIPKQLIPIANKPLIVYIIELLLDSGIDEIAIVINNNNKVKFQRVLNQYFTNDFEYIIQDNPKGIAHSLLFCEEFINEEKFIAVLGDNSFNSNLKSFIEDFMNKEQNCKILLKEVDSPEKYGIAYIGNNKIINLEEKPKIAFSNLAITGLYAFDNSIFRASREIQPSNGGEYEITDAIKWLLFNGYDIGYEILKGNWRDVGSPMNVIEENIYRLNFIDESIVGEIVNSHISGKVTLRKGSVIYNSIVRGPVIIGENTIIKNSYIGPYTSIGNEVKINKTNIESSIILDRCTILAVQNTIDYSILGECSTVSNENGLKKRNRLILGKGSRVYLQNS